MHLDASNSSGQVSKLAITNSSFTMDFLALLDEQTRDLNIDFGSFPQDPGAYTGTQKPASHYQVISKSKKQAPP